MSDTVIIENTQSVQQIDSIAQSNSQSSFERIFSNMCRSLLETVSNSKVIQNKCLLDFSRLAVQVISNAIEILPDFFDKLVKTFLDYMQYSVRNDTNQNRALSYIRAYQIACMLDVYRTEQKHEELLRAELKLNRQNKDLLYHIFHSPGITFSDLQTKLHCSDSELNERTRQLEGKKLLSSHQTEYENEPYYMLSRLGIDFCQDMFAARTRRVLPRQWSCERVRILYLLLEIQLESSDDTIPIMTWVRKVSELREDDVQYFVSRLKKHVHKYTFDGDSDEGSFTIRDDSATPVRLGLKGKDYPIKINYPGKKNRKQIDKKLSHMMTQSLSFYEQGSWFVSQQKVSQFSGNKLME